MTLQQQLDFALSRAAGGLRLPQELERLYRQSTIAGQKRDLQRDFLVLAAIHAASPLIDWSSAPQLLGASLSLRWGLCTPLCLLVAWMTRRDVGSWFLTTMIVVALLMQVASDVVVGGLTPDGLYEVYLLSAGLSIPLVNVLLSFDFRLAALQTAFCLILYAALLQDAFLHRLPGGAANLVLFAVLLAGASLVSSYRLELKNRRLFLMRMKDDLCAQELQRANEQLMILSLRDPLTGVGNRRSFNLAIERAWSTACGAGSMLGVLMIDADHFKVYNDTLGHAEGDNCLRSIAQALRCAVREPDDHVARFGGEEFVVVLWNTQPEAVQAAAERIRKSVEDLHIPHPGAKPGGYVTVSVGAAVTHPASDRGGSPGIVQAADAALYEAKRSGRNRVAVSTPGDSSVDQISFTHANAA